MDKYTRVTLLYDFYGGLLTQRQQEVTQLYYEDNLSLSEIAEEFGITRQGVHDALHNAEKSLNEYEEKLQLAKRFMTQAQLITKIDEKLDILVETDENKATVLEIKNIIKELKE